MADKIRIPPPFDQTISAVLKVKPPEKAKRSPKAGAKRPGRKPVIQRAIDPTVDYTGRQSLRLQFAQPTSAAANDR